MTGTRRHGVLNGAHCFAAPHYNVSGPQFDLVLELSSLMRNVSVSVRVKNQLANEPSIMTKNCSRNGTLCVLMLVNNLGYCVFHVFPS